MKQHKWHKECKECEALKQDINTFRKINQDLINKEWQGLSEDEVDECIGKSKWNDIDYCPDHDDFAKHIEQRLKEKNYGTT